MASLGDDGEQKAVTLTMAGHMEGQWEGTRPLVALVALVRPKQNREIWVLR